MTQKIIGLILVLCLFTVTGCSAQPAVSDQPLHSPDVPPLVVVDGDGTPAEATEVHPLAVRPNTITGSIQGDIKNIYYGPGTSVLIDADKLYLYDLTTGVVTAETTKESSFYASRYVALEDGFAAIGMTRDSSRGKIIFYTANLAKEEEITFAELRSGEGIHAEGYMDISRDGKYITYSTYLEGLNLYSRDTGKTTTLVKLDAPGSEFMNISEVRFSGDGKAVVFHSYEDNGSGSSADACGKINTDGTGLVNQRPGSFSVYELEGCYGEYALFSEHPLNVTGKTLVMNTSTGATTTIALATTGEKAAFGSDGGKYFATSSLSDSGCTVRIYEVQTGLKVYEETIGHGGNDLYVAREPVIRILDDAGVCIVLMGNRQDDLTTKATILEF